MRNNRLGSLADFAAPLSALEISGDANIDFVSTDTRTLASGALFVALVGERFDGHEFIEQAKEAGASALVVSNDVDSLGLPYLKVKDTTVALGALASWRREHFSGPLVSVTGSVGKTTIKGMLVSIFNVAGTCSSTKGNFNNQVGVPLTLLSADLESDFYVVEAGTNSKGEIDYLGKIIKPDVCVVSAVYSAHIEGFGSVDAIAEEKSDLYSNLRSDGTAVIDLNSPHRALFEKKSTASKALYFSNAPSAEANVWAESIGLNKLGAPSFNLCVKGGTSEEIRLAVLGEHQVHNALVAAACAYAAGVDVKTIAQGLSDFAGEAGRMNAWSWGGVTVVDDSYNASPASVKAAIDYLSRFSNSLLVLGELGELGDYAEQAHLELAEYAKQKNITGLYLMGKFAGQMVDVFAGNAKAFSSHEDVALQLQKDACEGLTILVKGSRFMQMDKIVKILKTKNEELC
jgi:UDP-N-acetylmuramoyl-tripeptide--D-alanyl-D-alanine ligase